MGRFFVLGMGLGFIGFFLSSNLLFFYIIMFFLSVAGSKPEPQRRGLIQCPTPSQDQQDLVMAAVSLVLSNPSVPASTVTSPGSF